jgi:3-hydroxyacyl-[acyl-carrier-protein] dehydratase
MGDALTEALRLLPHGAEFRFVERLVTLEPGCKGTAEYTVRGDEPFLRGHFPGQPMFPGVLLVEAAAQLAGIVAQSDPALKPVPELKLTAFRSIKILGTAKPGEVLQLEAKVTGRLANLIQAEVRVLVNGVPVVQGQLTLSGSAATA